MIRYVTIEKTELYGAMGHPIGICPRAGSGFFRKWLHPSSSLVGGRSNKFQVQGDGGSDALTLDVCAVVHAGQNHDPFGGAVKPTHS